MATREPIRVEAPTTASAMALLSDLARFGRLDLVPLDDGRWEVCLVEDLRTPMPLVLRTVEAWLQVWNAQETTVHIAGKPRRMTAREAGSPHAARL